MYKDNVSFTCPKVQENLSREKRTEYFKGVELTGKNIGVEKYPKMSLLDVTKNKIIIPAMEDKSVTRYNDGGRVKVCVVYQEDGVGLHQDKTYIREKRRSLKFEIGFFQPTSLITRNECP